MIPRYTRPEMGKIWTDDNKFAIWLEIEILACEAQAELGEMPKEDVKIIREKAGFDTKRILEIEETTKHDVIAFLTNVEEYVGEPSRFIHLGMTSSDILDTCFAVQCKQAGEILLDDLKKLADVLARRAREHKYDVCVGRSHGIHAEPLTFGLKMALYYDECQRNIKRMQDAPRRNFLRENQRSCGYIRTPLTQSGRIRLRKIRIKTGKHYHTGNSEGPPRFLYDYNCSDWQYARKNCH